MNEIETKICNDCGIERPITGFQLIGGKYRKNKCKNCYNRECREARKQKLNMGIIKTKICKECGKKLPLEKFRSVHDGKYTLNTCRECYNRINRENYSNKKYPEKEIDISEQKTESISFLSRDATINLSLLTYERLLRKRKINK